MPGMVKSVLVEVGMPVKKNTTVVILEAMKMENSITAGVEGTVKKILAVAGSSLDKNAVICEIQIG
jgi:biotin carboxyl carrier protein